MRHSAYIIAPLLLLAASIPASGSNVQEDGDHGGAKGQIFQERLHRRQSSQRSFQEMAAIDEGQASSMVFGAIFLTPTPGHVFYVEEPKAHSQVCTANKTPSRIRAHEIHISGSMGGEIADYDEFPRHCNHHIGDSHLLIW